jgi:histidinol-phosphate/aromatic aminotransferase/cobyric acid decarboxylase-like protein
VHVVVTPATAHGGLLDDELARLGLAPRDVVDFSVNVNPYGPHDAVVRAIREAPLARYPDPTGRAARAAIARHLGRDAAEIALGNGAVELLWSLARLLNAPGETCAVVGPTFSELASAVRAGRGVVAEWRASADDGFALPARASDAFLGATRPRALYRCNPQNPTGRALPAAAVHALAEAHPDVTVVLDQAFLSLSECHAEAAHAYPANVVGVRSLTKDHALPGLRVGYLVADPAIVRRLEASRPPWTASSLAQAAAVATLAHDGFVAESRTRMLADQSYLVAALAARGLPAVPSIVPYVLLAVPTQATALRARLLERHHLLVRDGTSFGLPRHVRLAARPAADVDRLVAALATELSST